MEKQDLLDTLENKETFVTLKTQDIFDTKEKQLFDTEEKQDRYNTLVNQDLLSTAEEQELLDTVVNKDLMVSEEKLDLLETDGRNHLLSGSRRLSVERLYQPPDGGWGWMVVFGCFMQYVIEAGLLTSYGVLYVEIMDTLGIDKVEVSWIGSVRTGIYLGAAPLVAPLTKFFSCRILTITGGTIAFISLFISVFMTSYESLLVCLGFLQGIAFALVFVSSNLIVNHYFDKNRPLAIGIAVCGAGVGQTLYPMLQDALLREYGLSGAMLINAALSLNIVFSGSTYFPLQVNKLPNTDSIKTEAKNTVCEDIKTIFDVRIFKMPIFVVFLTHNVFLYIGAFVTFAFLPDRVKGRGFSLNEASILVSMIGIGSSFGRVIIGFMSSKMTNFRPQFYVLLTFGAGVIVCILPFCSQYFEYSLFAVGFGFTTGGYICLCNVLLLDLFERDLLASSLGFVTLAQGIGGFIGSPAAAGFSEAVRSDDAIFYFSGATYILAGLVLQINLFCRSYNEKKSVTIKIGIGENNKPTLSTV